MIPVSQGMTGVVLPVLPDGSVVGGNAGLRIQAVRRRARVSRVISWGDLVELIFTVTRVDLLGMSRRWKMSVLLSGPSGSLLAEILWLAAGGLRREQFRLMCMSDIRGAVWLVPGPPHVRWSSR